MTRKAAITIETLTALGAQKLADLILAEARNNAAFRKRAKQPWPAFKAATRWPR